jgi:hypothetical protein
MPSFRREVKPSVPYCSFAACKKALQFPWKSHCSHFSPVIPPFTDRGLSRRLTWVPLEMRGELSSAQRARSLRRRCIGAVGPQIRVSISRLNSHTHSVLHQASSPLNPFYYKCLNAAGSNFTTQTSGPLSLELP